MTVSLDVRVTSPHSLDGVDIFKKEYQQFSQHKALANIVTEYLTPPENVYPLDLISFMPGIIALHYLTDGNHSLATRYPNPTFTYLQSLRNFANQIFCEDFLTSDLSKDESLLKEQQDIEWSCRDEVLANYTLQTGYFALSFMSERFASHPVINPKRFSSMQFAVCSDDSRIVKFMISECRLPVNSCTTTRISPLSCSIYYNPEITKLLIDAKADPDYPDNKGETCLHLAARYGNLKALQMLIAAGANLEHVSERGNTPLLEASYSAEGVSTTLENIKELIAAGAIVNRTGFQGRTPLMNALNNGWADIANYLLLRSDINLQNPEDGDSALFYATRKCLSIVNPLIQSRANVHLKDKDKRTALFYAICHDYSICNRRRDAIKSLLQAKADLYARDKFGKTALDYRPNRKEQVEEIIRSIAVEKEGLL